MIDRRLPFELAIVMFEGPTLETIDDRRDYGETRVKSIGALHDRAFVCVYTDRGDVRRIISLRLANRKERDDYRSAYPG